MNIALSPETQKLLDERLKTGEYRSADEALHAALEALSWVSTGPLDQTTLDAIDEGEDQIERGQVHDWKDVRQQVLDMFTK
jgi:Arc/MetJ-type ribon-helix-helix transcriptional regulator